MLRGDPWIEHELSPAERRVRAWLGLHATSSLVAFVGWTSGWTQGEGVNGALLYEEPVPLWFMLVGATVVATPVTSALVSLAALRPRR